MKIVRGLLVAFLLLSGVGARAQTLRVAAAKDLQFAMNKLSCQFEKSTGTKVAVRRTFAESMKGGEVWEIRRSSIRRFYKRQLSCKRRPTKSQRRRF